MNDSENAIGTSCGFAKSSTRNDSSITHEALRMPALDGLRGWAVIAVMLYHFALPFSELPHSRPTWTVLRLLLTGSYGVDMFFVLSGFLITGILLDSKASPSYFRTFYMRRLVRIFPLYYGVLAVSFGLFWWVPAIQEYVPRQGWLWLYAANLTPLAGFGIHSVFDHFWSLAVEEHFYLVWPVVVLLLSRRNLLLTCATILTVSPIARCALIGGGWMPAEAVSMFTPFRVDGLAMGALLAASARAPGGLVQFRSLAVWLVVVGTFATLCSKALYGSVSGSMWGMSGIGHLTISVAVSGILILAVTGEGFWQSVLSNSTLRTFGKFSYGLYVFHHLLQPWLDPNFWYLTSLPVVSLLIHMVIATAISLIVAMASWHLFEKHFLKLKSRYQYQPAVANAPSDENVVSATALAASR